MQILCAVDDPLSDVAGKGTSWLHQKFATHGSGDCPNDEVFLRYYHDEVILTVVLDLGHD